MTQILTAADLAWARACQAALMTATCTITAPGDGWEWDGTTDVPTTGAVIYQGACRVQAEDRTQGRQTPAGGQDIATAQYVGAVPWDTVGVEPGQTITVTACMDPDLVGARLTVSEVEGQTVALSARRFRATRDH